MQSWQMMGFKSGNPWNPPKNMHSPGGDEFTWFRGGGQYVMLTQRIGTFLWVWSPNLQDLIP